MMLKQNCWVTKGHYDVIVVGAGPGGIGAALASARRGMKTALIETYGFAGGVGTQSCCAIFYGFGVDGKQTTAGISEEFIRRMDDLGAASFLLNQTTDMPEFKPIAGRPLQSKIALQPEIMKLVYNRMLRESGVDCYFYTQMADVLTEGNQIKAVLLSGLEGTYFLEAETYIDATGNAQIAYMASPEAVNVCPAEKGMHNSMFFEVGGVTPFDVEYAKRLYSEAYANGKLPEMVWPHFGFSTQLNPGTVQIAVCYEIGNGADSREMTRMDMDMRENVEKVLDFLKKEMPGFRNCYLLKTATKVGVRTSRNIVSMHDFSKELLFSDELYHPVALCRRIFGMHSNSKADFCSKWTRIEKGCSAVPMEALQSKVFENILAAGRCIGSDPELIGTYRMMNTCMTIGEAAGLIAKVAHNKGIPVQQVQYTYVHPLLKENGFILA